MTNSPTKPVLLDEKALAEIEARASKATIGPWIYFGEPLDQVEECGEFGDGDV